STSCSATGRDRSEPVLAATWTAWWSIDAQRDCKMKNCATLRAVFSPDPPAIGLDDCTRDLQSEAGSMFFGRVKGLENLANLCVRDTRTAIDHCHPGRGLVEQCCSNDHSPRIQRDVAHCVHCIRCQVEYDLQQMHGISSYQQ